MCRPLDGSSRGRVAQQRFSGFNQVNLKLWLLPQPAQTHPQQGNSTGRTDADDMLPEAKEKLPIKIQRKLRFEHDWKIQSLIVTGCKVCLCSAGPLVRLPPSRVEGSTFVRVTTSTLITCKVDLKFLTRSISELGLPP
ncbi:hypothetical protein Nepgr_016261 [Nepenthes gracilis]|uniref:Uncharacterized protein n=1 Tax=Nepenthes gracilis TaxID=150966 RepID=A0AAD3SMD9_NEPGR|nr:hypothetical protein Nepgr_016261 [Nepenthes gracilis]